MKIENQINN